MVRTALSVVPDPGAVPTRGEPALGAAGLISEILREDLQPTPLTSAIGGSGWTVRAVCVGADPDALFVTGAAQREAAKICQACPVRLECLADALDNQIEYGVWGGMTERQRRAVLKKSPDVTNWRLLLEGARASVSLDQEAAS